MPERKLPFRQKSEYRISKLETISNIKFFNIQNKSLGIRRFAPCVLLSALRRKADDLSDFFPTKNQIKNYLSASSATSARYKKK